MMLPKFCQKKVVHQPNFSSNMRRYLLWGRSKLHFLFCFALTKIVFRSCFGTHTTMNGCISLLHLLSTSIRIAKVQSAFVGCVWNSVAEKNMKELSILYSSKFSWLRSQYSRMSRHDQIIYKHKPTAFLIERSRINLPNFLKTWNQWWSGLKLLNIEQWLLRKDKGFFTFQLFVTVIMVRHDLEYIKNIKLQATKPY